MKKIDSTLKQLEKLAKICKTKGVSIEFFQDGSLKKISKDVPDQSSLTPAPQARVSAKKASQIEEAGNLQDQYDKSTQEIETLHVEDPSAYEALLMQGALGEEKIN